MNALDRISKQNHTSSPRSIGGRPQRRFALRPLTMALFAASMLSLPGIAVPPAQAQAASAALPSGLSVVQGQASAVVSGQQMTVTNSANSILNWQSFSIGSTNGVHFAQPDSASQVLNRVVGNDPSAILGSLSSNGRIWLLNPNGVLFGQGARVDVAGLVTSTLRLNDIDWLNGRYNFAAAANDPTAGIVNQGELRSSLGGRIALLGGSVRNEGLIDAPGGQVMLAAGRSIELVDTGTPNLRLRVTAPDGEAMNLGSLTAAGGRIDIHAAMVNQQGIVRADSLGTDAAGQVELRATQTLDLAAGSVTSASGTTGGSVTLDGGAAGKTLVRGDVLASGSVGSGGQVQVLGQQVGLLDAASIDASGASGGGQVLVGGGQEGKDPSVRNSDGVYVGPNTQINADATGAGDGGRVILWGNTATRAYGSLVARGGPLGGDGGFIETSGGWIDARPAHVDASAANGRAGTWLIDPYFDITISDDAYGGSIVEAPPGNFESVDNGASINSATIRQVLNGGSSVVVTTGECVSCTSGEFGDIFVTSANLAVSPTSAVSLTLNAARNIDITASTITSNTLPLSVSLNAGRSGEGNVSVRNGSVVDTRGGNFFASGIGFLDEDSSYGLGVWVEGSSIAAGAGNISLNGLSDSASFFGRSGIRITDSNLSGRDITLEGISSAIDQSFSYGVNIENSTLTASHALDIRGTASHTGVFAGFDSSLQVRPLANDPTASMNIEGTSTWADFQQDGFISNYGVDLGDYGGSLVASNGATINVLGRQNEGSSLPSLNMRDGLLVDAASSGDATFTANSPLQISGNIIVGGQLGFFGDDVTIAAGTTVQSNATGDAIVIAGKSGPNTFTFVNNAGPAALATPNGRWLIYGQNTASLISGDLAYDFKQYNARFGEANALTPATGNGLLYTEAPVVTVRADPFVKTYDGTVNAGPLTGLSVIGQRDGDIADLAAGSGEFVDKNAGLNKQINLTGTSVSFIDITGKPVLGYGFAGDLRGDILQKAVTLSGVSAANKFYDGNTSAVVTIGALNGLIAGETLGTNASGNFDTKDAGIGKTVTVNASLVDGGGGGLASNYTLAPGATTTTANIDRRQLAATFSADNKVYDGNTNATVTVGALSGLVAGETLGTSASGNFDTKDAGIGKTVTVNANLVDGGGGGLASNYEFAPGATSTTANIDRRQLTGTFSADNKVYDGNTAATVTVGNLSGLVGIETLGTSASGNFDTKDAGIGKTVTVNATLADGTNGGLASNYLAPVGATTTADITRRIVTTSGVSAANKVYDGNTSAVVTIGALSGLVGSETLGTTASGNFDTKDAGTGKTVTVGTTLSDGTNGGLASNYQLAAVGNTTADITRRQLTGTFSAANKVYDGNTNASVTVGLGNLVGSETLDTGATTGSFDTKDAGNGKLVTVNLGLADGTNGGLASNYLAPVGPTTTTADITRRNLQLSSLTAADKVYDGNAIASLTLGSVTNLVGSETLAVTASGLFNNQNVGTNKPVSVTLNVADGLNGGLASNYNVPTLPAAAPRASITPAPLTYTADQASKLVGAPLPAFSGTVSGFVAGETQASATSGSLAFVSPADASSPAGQYAINGTGLSASNYEFFQAPSNATALTVSGLSPNDTNEGNSSTAAQNLALATVTPTPVWSSPAEGRVFDVIQTLSGNYLGQGALFRAIPVADLSQDSLTGLLAARDHYKKTLFAEAIRKLEQNPSLADVPACTTAREVDNGTCLITEDLKRQLRAQRASLQVASPAPAAAPSPAPAAAPAAPPVATAPSVEIPAAPPRQGVGIAVEPAAAPAPIFALRQVRSAALPQIERKIALVIGVNRYPDRRMPQLENAVGDAQAIGRILEDRLGYETVVLENADKASVVRALNRLAVELDPKDSVVVYYAGHGELIKSTGLGYWQLSDANPTQPETWMSNADISRVISHINADQVAVISDSCYSGSLVDERIRATPGTVDPQQLLAKKTVVVMSSGGNEPVFDEGKNGHSPFAYSLMRNLEQLSNWQVGGNVFERVRFAVARELPQRPLYGAAAAAGHQPGGDYLFEQRQLDK